MLVAPGLRNPLAWEGKREYYLPTFNPAEWRRPEHGALSTFQGCCVDTRSFAEVAEVSQRKFCQEERCRARQCPPEYVLCVYVWLYSDSFYQIRDDVNCRSSLLSHGEGRVGVGVGLEGG